MGCASSRSSRPTTAGKGGNDPAAAAAVGRSNVGGDVASDVMSDTASSSVVIPAAKPGVEKREGVEMGAVANGGIISERSVTGSGVEESAYKGAETKTESLRQLSFSNTQLNNSMPEANVKTDTKPTITNTIARGRGRQRDPRKLEGCQSAYYISDGREVVYTEGQVVVVMDVEARGQQRFYSAHTSEVQCLAVHAKSGLAASGQSHGRDTLIHIWHTSSLKTHVVLRSSPSSSSPINSSPASAVVGVAVIAWTESASALVAVDADNSVTVWDVRDSDKGRCMGKVYGGVKKIHAAAFIGKSLRFATCGTTTRFWSMQAGTVKLEGEANVTASQLRLQNSQNKVSMFACTMFSDSFLIAASSTGLLCLYELETTRAEILQTRSSPVHSGPIRALDTTKGHVVSGGDDGKVCMVFVDGNNGEMRVSLTHDVGAPIKCVCMHPTEDKVLVRTKAGGVYELHVRTGALHMLLKERTL